MPEITSICRMLVSLPCVRSSIPITSLPRSGRLTQLMRMNYETMHLFTMNRLERTRCLNIMNEYYRLHLPDFPVLKSLEVLKELFD